MAIFSCVGCLTFPLWFGDRIFYVDINEPSNELVVDGNQLLVNHHPDGKTFVVVPGIPATTHVEITKVQDRYLLLIHDGKDTYSKSAEYIGDAFWSETNHFACFVLLNDKHENEVWTWSKATSFRKLIRTKNHYFRISESLDGKFLWAFGSTIGHGDDKAHLFAQVISAKDWNVEQIPVTWPGGFTFAVDSRRLIIEGQYEVVDREAKEGQFEVNKKTVGRSIDGYLWDYHAFRGQIWALRRISGHETVVRISQDLDSVNQVVELPKKGFETGPHR